MISTLVWMKWPTNVGYAIGALEQLFFEVATELAAGDQSRVPFRLSGPVVRAAAVAAGRVPQHHLHEHRRCVATGAGSFGNLPPGLPVDFVLTFDVQPVHPAFQVMRRRGVKTIVSSWGAPISSPMPSWKLALKKAQMRLSSARADALVFEYVAMAELALNGRGVPESMIEIVPLGVDVARFRPAASDHVNRVFRIPRDRKVVVFSGHCTPRKGIATLVEAAIESSSGASERTSAS